MNDLDSTSDKAETETMGDILVDKTAAEVAATGNNMKKTLEDIEDKTV